MKQNPGSYLLRENFSDLARLEPESVCNSSSNTNVWRQLGALSPNSLDQDSQNTCVKDGEGAGSWYSTYLAHVRFWVPFPRCSAPPAPPPKFMHTHTHANIHRWSVMSLLYLNPKSFLWPVGPSWLGSLPIFLVSFYIYSSNSVCQLHKGHKGLSYLPFPLNGILFP